MNLKQLKGSWLRLRGDVAIAWGRITDNPLTVEAGMRDQRAGLYKIRLGISDDHAVRQLREFHDRNRNWNPTHH